MSRRVTISDIAQHCGVTPATVSRVLNGKSKFSVSATVRDKIKSTAARLGYAPDLAARNLNRRSTHIVGVFAAADTHFAQGINESLLQGVSERLHASGFDVFFELSASGDRAGLPSPIPDWRFDGAILMQAPSPETVAELDRRRVPYVCVNENVGSPVACVLADDAMGMRRAVEHLASLGHTRLAYANARANTLSHYSVADRHDTLLAEVKKRKLRLTPGHAERFTSAETFLRQAVVTGHATAVITYDHYIAIALMGAAHTLELSIPQDFSLVCFNDVFPTAIVGPALTAVSVSGREMGRTGADLLLKHLAQPDSAPTPTLRMPEDLILRASTSSPAPRTKVR